MTASGRLPRVLRTQALRMLPPPPKKTLNAFSGPNVAHVCLAHDTSVVGSCHTAHRQHYDCHSIMSLHPLPLPIKPALTHLCFAHDDSSGQHLTPVTHTAATDVPAAHQQPPPRPLNSALAHLSLTP